MLYQFYISHSTNSQNYFYLYKGKIKHTIETNKNHTNNTNKNKRKEEMWVASHKRSFYVISLTPVSFQLVQMNDGGELVIFSTKVGLQPLPFSLPLFSWRMAQSASPYLSLTAHLNRVVF